MVVIFSFTQFQALNRPEGPVQNCEVCMYSLHYIQYFYVSTVLTSAITIWGLTCCGSAYEEVASKTLKNELCGKIASSWSVWHATPTYGSESLAWLRALAWPGWWRLLTKASLLWRREMSKNWSLKDRDQWCVLCNSVQFWVQQSVQPSYCQAKPLPYCLGSISPIEEFCGGLICWKYWQIRLSLRLSKGWGSSPSRS